MKKRSLNRMITGLMTVVMLAGGSVNNCLFVNADDYNVDEVVVEDDAEYTEVGEVEDKVPAPSKETFYLSEASVASLDAEGLAAYQELQDEVAEIKKDTPDIDNIIYTLDAEGGLSVSFRIPNEALYRARQEMMDDVAAELNGDAAEVEEQNADEEEFSADDLYDESEFIASEESEAAVETKSCVVSNVDLAASYFDNLAEEECFYEDRNPVFNTTMSASEEGFYVKQLNASEKKYYTSAEAAFKKGKNTFSVYKGNFRGKADAAAQVNYMKKALCAVELTCPQLLEFKDMSQEGGLWLQEYKRGLRVVKTEFYVKKSQYFSEANSKAAADKAASLAKAAFAYANQNYPTAVAYGVVKYYDQWLCENAYYDDKIGVASDARSMATETYYCDHRVYGCLMKGLGVCESYALAMSYLLDAAGIQNLYIVGDVPGGGHAWNYVKMPDGNYYLQDTTWNDTTDPAHKETTGEFLLTANDSVHRATGGFWRGITFNFPTVSTSKYQDFSKPEAGEISFAQKAYYLKPKGKAKIGLAEYYDTWDQSYTSSDPAVATVDTKGNIKAKKAGKCQVTCEVAGKKCAVDVYVYKISALKDATTNKKSSKLEVTGNSASNNVVINVVQKDKADTAENMIKNNTDMEPVFKMNKKAAETVKCTFTAKGDQIIVGVQALQKGKKANVTVKFGGKSFKIKVKT